MEEQPLNVDEVIAEAKRGGLTDERREAMRHKTLAEAPGWYQPLVHLLVDFIVEN